jgi:hypothetical protein
LVLSKENGGRPIGGHEGRRLRITKEGGTARLEDRQQSELLVVNSLANHLLDHLRVANISKDEELGTPDFPPQRKTLLRNGREQLVSQSKGTL